MKFFQTGMTPEFQLTLKMTFEDLNNKTTSLDTSDKLRLVQKGGNM